MIGKEVVGKIKNITDFGIFVELNKMGDGLLHKRNLPSTLKGRFKDAFKCDQRIKVKVEGITKKGIDLSLVQPSN